MASFTRVWDATYLSLPEDDDDALEGASRIRHTRVDVGERMAIDHSWVGDAHDGKHKKVTLRPSATDPTLDADDIALYGKAVGSNTELFYKSEAGQVTQLTFTTGAPQSVPPSAVLACAGAVPSGFLECDGSAVSRTTFSALFAAIGTTYGVGNGTTTFNLPDIKGRTIFGKEVSESRLTSAISGINGGTLGAAGGNQSPQAHTHTGGTNTVGNHQHTGAADVAAFNTNGAIPPYAHSGGGALTGAAGSHSHTFTTDGSGVGSSGNVPPGIVLRWGIKT